jgi:titin
MQGRRARPLFRPVVKALEDRVLLNTYTVTSTADSGAHTLRQAILSANSHAGLDTIKFNIPGSGVHTIVPLSPLPAITDAVILDGTSQGGYAGTPLIELDGASAGSNVDGLDITAAGSTVKGLAINRFTGSGIAILSGSGNTITADYLGTDPTGTTAEGNGNYGILIAGGASSNRVGGDGSSVAADAAARNVISGNAWSGVGIFNSGTNNNVVAGNYIGTTANGEAALKNGNLGVWIGNGAQSNRIGTSGAEADNAGERNVISGNNYQGVGIFDTGTNSNVVAGNYIGTDATGTTPLANGNNGVIVGNGAQSNRVGTNADGIGDAAEANVIAANTWSGVVITDSGTSINVVAGNFIGTNASSATGLGNGNYGVFVGNGATSNRVGADGSGATADASDRNVISANAWSGVGIFNSGTNNNVVAGNYIGTTVNGEAALKNGNLGVWIGNGAQSNRIGTSGAELDNAGERNVISGNNYQGVGIFDTGTNSNVVAGNYIGTDTTGTAALGNGNNGIWIGNGAQSNRIGTNGDGVGDAAERNVISANTYAGVAITDAGTNANLVAGNYIGTDYTGTSPLANLENGIFLANGAQGNSVGGSAVLANVIANNAWAGVAVTDNATTGNSIRANSIYADGGLGIDLGLKGVQIDHVGTTTGPNNLQNYPVITTATPGASTAVGGTLYALPSTAYTLDFYANPSHDISFYGPGQTYLGSAPVTTGASGHATFSVTLAVATTTGEWVTATATDPSGNTSEFSGDRPLPTTPMPLSPLGWTAVGPAPIAQSYPYTGAVMSGRVITAVPHPTNNNVMYLFADGGGVWKTSDWLDTSPVWTPLTDSQSSISSGGYKAVAISPSSPSTIYAAVDGPGGGILKSTNGGTTWALLGSSVFNQSGFSGIAVDPNNASNLYATVWYGPSTNSAGVWHSTDGGSTWTNTTAAIHSTSTSFSIAASDIVMDPANSSILYAGLVRDDPTGSQNGVYETTDGGTTWTQLTSGLPTGSAVGTSVRVAEAHSSPTTLYATIFDTSSVPHRYTTTNGGTSWTELPALPTNEELRYWHTVLSVDPNNAQTVYVNGDHTLYRSTNGGSTWVELDNSEDPTGIYFDNSGKFILTGDHGIYRQNSPNYYINKQGNLQDSEFYDIALDPNNPSTIYGIAQDQFQPIKGNGYPAWTAVGALASDGGGTGETGRILVDPTNPAILYRYTPLDPNNFLYVSNDGGVSWQPAGSGIPTGLATDPNGGYTFAYASQLAFTEDLGNHSRLILGTNQVYESTNGGTSFTAISAVLSPSSTLDDQFITAVAIAPSAPSTVYAATHDGRLFYTTNDGTSWTEVDTGLPVNRFDTYVEAIAIDPSNPQRVFITTGAHNNPFGSPGVFMTTNGGTAWTAINGTGSAVIPSQQSTDAMAVDWRLATPVLYVGTTHGVYRSLDLGTTWTLFGQGLPNAHVTDLEFLPSADILAVSTYGRGVFEIIAPGPATTLTATPNPTAVTAGKSVNVTVEAFDALGYQATAYTGTVQFSSTDVQAGLPTNYPFTAADNGLHVFAVTLKTAGMQTVTVQDTVNSGLKATTVGILVNPAAAKKLKVAGFPKSTVSGAAHSVTVTAVDAYGNVATGYTGTIHFTTSDPSSQVKLPHDYTFAAADQGVHKFPNGVTLITVGTQTIVATDTVKKTITGQEKVTVTAASLIRSAFRRSETPGPAFVFGLGVAGLEGEHAGDTVGAMTSTVQAGVPSVPVWPHAGGQDTGFAVLLGDSHCRAAEDALADTGAPLPGDLDGQPLGPGRARSWLRGLAAVLGFRRRSGGPQTGPS